MTCVIRFAVFTAFIFAAFPVFSQISDSTLLPATDANLKEVVIQATRANGKSPIPHNNLTAGKIALSLQTQDVPYLLSGTPSLVESSDGGTGTGYTGLRIRGSDPTQVNVTINGVPLNDAESQGVYWVDLPDLAASAAEIQVQRGVGASTNGAGAFGATVNLDLSKVAAEPGAVVSASLGSFATRKFSAQVATGLLPNHWSFSGRGSVIHSDGYVDRAASDLNSLHLSVARVGERRSFQAHLLSGKEITYQAWNGLPAQYLDNEKLRTYNSAGAERPGEPYADEVDNYQQTHYLAHYKEILTPQLMLQLNAHYTHGAGYYEQYKAGQSFENYGFMPFVVADTVIETTDLVRRRWLDNDFYGATFALRWTPVSGSNLLLGGAASRYKGEHFGEVIWTQMPVGVPKDYRYYDNSAQKDDANLYLKAERQFGQKLTAFLDVQGRNVQYQFFGFNADLTPATQQVSHFFFNPKAGLTYSLSSSWSAYAFWGIAHREPNRDDYTQSTPASRPSAERLADVEFGSRYAADKAAFTANLFWMNYHNQLVLDGRINDVGAYIRTNVPESYRAGIELEGSGVAGAWLTWAGNVSLSTNKTRSFTEYRDNWDDGSQELVTYKNTDIAFSPCVISRGEVTCFLLGTAQNSDFSANNTVSVSLSGKYVGKQYLDNTANEAAVLPGYFFSDLRLNVALPNRIGREIDLVLACNNWLNAQYVSNGWVYRYISAGYDARPDDAYTALEGDNVYHQAGYFPQAGRNWMATVRVVF